MKPVLLLLVCAAGVASADPLVDAVEAGDVAKIEALLSRKPARAATRTAKGVSLVAIAGTRNPDGEGFVCTRDNPPLRALLARAPTLDVFDAALVGDVARLAALVAEDPARARALHPFGWRPLHFAAFGGKLEAVRLLLAGGAELDARAQNRFTNTALQTALLCAEVETAAWLLERGADPNVRQDLGFVPLHEAAFLGRTDLIELLLAHGAAIDVRNDKGESPVGTAVRRGHLAAAALLRARGGKD